MAHMLPYFCSVRVTSLDCAPDLPNALLPRLHQSFHPWLMLSTRVPTVLSHCGTGISTCCPSATPLGLALGPDLPRADQLYSGNLGYSAGRIPTFLSLLIPAFSTLDIRPEGFPPSSRYSFRHSLFLKVHGSLPVPLRPFNNAPLPMYCYIPELRQCVSAPDIFGAGPLD